MYQLKYQFNKKYVLFLVLLGSVAINAMEQMSPEKLLQSIQNSEGVPSHDMPSHIDKLSLLREKNKSGETILHVACKQGDVASVLKICQIVDADLQDLLFRPDMYGDLCIHKAAEKGHDAVIDALIRMQIQAGKDPWPLISHANIACCTPLHLVARCGNVKAAQLLVQGSGENASQLIFKEHCNKDTPLHQAAELNRAEMVKFLLAASGKLAAKLTYVSNSIGLNAIHKAIYNNRVEVIKAFMQVADEVGDLLLLKNPYGCIFLDYAKKLGKTEIIAILEEAYLHAQKKLAGAVLSQKINEADMVCEDNVAVERDCLYGETPCIHVICHMKSPL